MRLAENYRVRHLFFQHRKFKDFTFTDPSDYLLNIICVQGCCWEDLKENKQQIRDTPPSTCKTCNRYICMSKLRNHHTSRSLKKYTFGRIRTRQSLDLHTFIRAFSVRLHNHWTLQTESAIVRKDCPDALDGQDLYCLHMTRRHVFALFPSYAASYLHTGRVKRKSAFEHAQNKQSDHPAHAQCMYYPGLWSPFTHSMVCKDSVKGQWRPWSNCANAQFDQGLRCLHMLEVTFPQGPWGRKHDSEIDRLMFRIWTAMWENVPSVMCAQRRLKSDCASA